MTILALYDIISQIEFVYLKQDSTFKIYTKLARECSYLYLIMIVACQGEDICIASFVALDSNLKETVYLLSA